MGLLSGVPEVSLVPKANLTEKDIPCCGETLCRAHERDDLYLKPMRVCWSLSESREFHGELPAMSQHTKEIVMQEAILLHKREEEAERYERFKA